MAMAVERADDVAAAMQIKDRRIAVGAGGREKFGAQSANRNRLDDNICGHAVFEPARVDIPAPLPVVGRARPTCQLGAQCPDFRIAHLGPPLVVCWAEPSTKANTGDLACG